VKPSIVSFQNVSKRYGACVSLAEVSAEFAPARLHAILGENGAGKSTLMKVLFGLVRADEGVVRVEGVEKDWKSPADAIAAGLGMVQQHFTLVPSLSVIDNIMLGREGGWHLDRAAAIAEIEAKLPDASLRMDWNRRVEELSVGEQQRVEILKLIARDSRIMVLDEPTAVLVPQEIDALFSLLKKLRYQGRSVFVITHKLSEVFQHCDTWSVLRLGRLVRQGEVRDSSLEEVVRAMMGSEPPPPIRLQHRTRERNTKELLDIRSLSSAQKGRGALRDVSLKVESGEILGIAGVDGSGQSQLIDAMLGLHKTSGEILWRGERLESGRRDDWALISEDRHRQSLWMEESVELNAGLGVEGQFCGGASATSLSVIDFERWGSAVSKWLAEFDVRFPHRGERVSRLSGGNQQKLIFARELLGRDVKFVLAHQPTRGVDLGAIHQIHQRLVDLRDQGVGVLLVSSELDELMALADRIVVLESGRVAAQFDRWTESSKQFDRALIGRAMIGASV
jgi:ABC-type uncharacterized transport system ATPase subunit